LASGTASALAARAWKQVREPSAILLSTQLISIVLRLCSNLVLARLLVPRDFGMVAITAIIATALAMFSDTGAWLSIVRKGDELTRQWLDQLWTLHVVRGVVLWLMAVAATPAIASIYGEPQLMLLLPVATLWLVIGGMGSLYPLVRNKDLKPGFSMKLQLMSQAASTTCSIAGALIYPSPWALVGGLLAGSVTTTVMGHAWSGRPLPKLRLTREFMREQWLLARWLIVSTGLGFLGGQIDRLLFPAWFGMTEFGVYSVALTLALFPLQFGQSWADTLYMPAIAKLSRQQSDSAEKQLRHLTRTVVVYAAVASALLAGIGGPFFHALYPKQFAPAGLFIQILAVTTYATFVTYLHRRTFLYQGMTRLEASIEASRLLLFLLSLGAAFVMKFKLSVFQYVGLYAAVQVAVYGGLVILGRMRRLVHLRDDLPGHAIFIVITIGMILLGNAVEQRFGAFVALVLNGSIGAIIGLVTAARLGLPKLPTGERPPEPPPQDLAASPESFDPLRET
jgi:O-antigen/teichoic acid export membrane protein